MLADLDETLRTLLKTELERHGFEGVDIAFDAPAREWSGQLSKPTVNIFLYDLREAEGLRTSEWSRATVGGRAGGRPRRGGPPPRLSWRSPSAVRGGPQGVKAEPGLPSQFLGILFPYP